MITVVGVAFAGCTLILAAIERALIIDEVRAWLPHFSAWLIRQAARRLPGSHGERYAEEWLAELEALADRQMTALLFATRVFVRAGQTRAQLGASGEVETGERSFASRRTLARRLAEEQALSQALHASAISAVFRTLRMRDPRTADHSAAVARYAQAIAAAAGYSKDVQTSAYVAGLLHDIGKLALPDSLLGSSKRLTEGDWSLIRTHTEHGASVVEGVSGYDGIAEAIRSHHERLDGRGYPNGLAGCEIPLLARVVAVADVYDVMTAANSYRVPQSGEEAVIELRRVAGAQLDVDLVDVLAALVRDTRLPARTISVAVNGEDRVAHPASSEPIRPFAQHGRRIGRVLRQLVGRARGRLRTP
jgi:putative nucleotidyltransferase with HDIG domain